MCQIYWSQVAGKSPFKCHATISVALFKFMTIISATNWEGGGGVTGRVGPGTAWVGSGQIIGS